MINYTCDFTERNCLVHCAVLDTWEFEGETFGVTLCARPVDLPKCIFSVVHLATGLAAVKGLAAWDKGRQEFDRIVAKHGSYRIHQAIAQGRLKHELRAPWIVHRISPDICIFERDQVHEVWSRDKCVGTFPNMGSAAQLANIIKSLGPAA